MTPSMVYDMGDRFKDYERRSTYYLPRKSFVIVRVDGKSFHGLPLEKPFDQGFINSMSLAAADLFIWTGALFGYVQSDEVSLLLTDTRRVETEPWFDFNIAKVVSLTAARMSVAFNKLSRFKDCIFDSRAFVVPENDVANYFLWRAKDWERNSLQMLTRSLYSHKECHKANQAKMHEMLHAKGVNWADLPSQQKNGTFFWRKYEVNPTITSREVSHIIIDDEILPRFETINERVQYALEHYRM